ncbi:MAG: carbon-nitrogen hydrolase family protein [Clostridiales bacterium]|jgi:predicted amidohydrolase|nr:carbon-nitrogen hydrolase family protein [Eubacteriales bacterium]MDH7565190.1 carbon-nitrogen hydrolase family protein [Clostridiales bacterium]
MPNKFNIAICQMNVINSKSENLKKAVAMIEASGKSKADIVVLPEMFNCPYDNKKFSEYAEHAHHSETIDKISETARKLKMYVIAGSIPEIERNRIYNSCFVFNRKGEVIGRHRKLHLFDIDIKGEIKFTESEILTAGEEITVIDTEFCKIGIAICYDIRFPELFRLMALKGAKLMVVPGAFNMTTGPAHWETLIRARAIDNQVYIAAASPARDENSSYRAYGNSMVADPWGTVTARADAGECIIFSDIDLLQVEKVRRELPLLKHRRVDIYLLEEMKRYAPLP